MRTARPSLTRPQRALLRRLAARGPRSLTGLWKRAAQVPGARPEHLSGDLARLVGLGLVTEVAEERRITFSCTASGHALVATWSTGGAGGTRCARRRGKAVHTRRVFLAPLVGVSISACTTLTPSPIAQYNEERPVSFQVLHQVRVGDRGVFVSCAPCSSPTPKTVDVPAPSLVAIEGPPVAPLAQPAAQTVDDVRRPLGGSTARHAQTATERDEVVAAIRSGDGAAVPVMRTLSFASGQFRLTPEQNDVVRAIAQHGGAAVHVQVRGYTDGSGDARTNRSLALARASRVRLALLKHGLSADLISTTWCTDCYVASNETTQGKSRNRRVEVELVLPPSAVAHLPAGFQRTHTSTDLHARARL